MAQVAQVYCLPVVHQDLETEQTVAEMLSAFDRLDEVVGDVFNRIQKRVDAERERLSAVNSRIGACQAKVAALTGTNRATTVFSSSRYPVTDAVAEAQPLYADRPFMETPFVPEDPEDAHFLPAETQVRMVGESPQGVADLMELLWAVNPRRPLKRAEESMDEEGLGRLPAYLPSVSGMLLFNSSKTPYRDYTNLDNLLGKDFDDADGESKADAMAAAPTTLIDGDLLPHVAAEDLSFKPQMGAHQGLDLPSNLPLPDVASDLTWSAGDAGLGSIAPSVMGGNLLALPAPDSLPDAPSMSEPPPPPDAPGGSAPPPPPPGPAASAPPPPPPPPPGPAAPAAAAAPAEAAAAPPPPPPPVPGPAPAAPAGGPSTPAAPTGRASLLDAIRGQSVSSLKKAAEREVSESKKVKEKAAAKPLSMADEMRMKLQRRQAAISGSRDKQQQRRASANNGRAPPPANDSDSSGSESFDDDEGVHHHAHHHHHHGGRKEPEAAKQPEAQLPKLPTLPPRGGDDGGGGGARPHAKRGSILDPHNQTLNRLLSAPADDGGGSGSDSDAWDDEE